MNHELPDVQTGFRKGKGTREQIANILWIIKKARVPEKNIFFCFIDYAKAFDSVDHNKLWKILKEMGIADHLICILRNLYAGQETSYNWTWNNRLAPNRERSTSRYILSPCFFNLYAEYIMQNPRLDEAQARIKIAGKISITSEMERIPPLWQKVKKNYRAS